MNNSILPSNASQIDITKLCAEILEKDNDGKITSNELKLFIEQLGADDTQGLDTVNISNQMKAALGSKYVEDSAHASNSDSLNKNLSFSVEEYNALLEQISNLENNIELNNTQLIQLKATIADQQKDVDDKKKAFKNQEEKLAKENDNYKKIIEQIDANTEKLNDDIKYQQKALIYKGLADYDPNKDEDWESYINKFIVAHPFESVFETNLKSLIKTADEKGKIIKSLSNKLKVTSEELISANNLLTQTTSQYNDVQAAIDTDTASLQAAKESAKNHILSLVSVDELNLATQNNINFQETLSNGKPRYIFAKGKEDGAFHIYDMSNGASLARKYGCDSGFDIVPMGNGYINDFSEAKSDSCDAQQYYYYNECGEIASSCATYTTCSPLSFDINGNGVKTSDKIINYDIDGDGVVDRINDSADAVLVFDKDGDGISGADGSETFGNNTDLDGDGVKDGYKDGFEALKALAKKEGVINGIDDNELDENDLKFLEKKYGLKIKADGYNSEAKSLSELGITCIKFSADNSTSLKDNFDGKGNQLMTQQGATFIINGEERSYADIWHKKQETETLSDSSAHFILPPSAISFDMNKTSDVSAKFLSKAQDAADRAYEALKNADLVENNIFLDLITKTTDKKSSDKEKLTEEQRTSEAKAEQEVKTKEEARKKKEEPEEK